MGTLWLWLVAVGAVCAGADRQGSSLRGALEALQRRQRSRGPGPIAPQPDYDALYEFFPPQVYADPDYGIEIDDKAEDPNSKYMFKLLDNDERPQEAYEYKIIKKKKLAEPTTKKESAFRERSHHSDNDRLRDLFIDRNDVDENKEMSENHAANDAEYALLLGQLWTKYKNNKGHNEEVPPQGVVKLYKEKQVKKRYPENWGPIAFKKKRSSDSEVNRPVIQDYEERRLPKPGPVDGNYNTYEISDDDKDDMSEEYAIAFQPLDDDSLIDLGNEDQYNYETVEKRFPVTKRSSGSYNFGIQKKRLASDQSKRDISKRFRSSSGTDPRILRDLSKIFGDSEGIMVKNPVKRSSDNQEHEHNEGKPPNLSVIHNNNTHEHSNVSFDDESHEHHGHNLHRPGVSGKEVEHMHNGDHNDHAAGHAHTHDQESEHPIKLRKKSIDWSDYFGIDKRKKKSVSFVNNLTEERLKKQYFDTFNKEIIYPLNSFRQHNNVKRNYGPAKSNEDTEIQIDRAKAIAIHDGDKKRGASENDSKLDNIDKKLRNMEDLIVDEALHYSNAGEKLDSKEEQEMKEKLLSRLAAAYSLEKMRKALKEFKQSLQTQKSEPILKSSPIPDDEMKTKRIAVKKEKADLMSNEIPIFQKDAENNRDFEEEQGAGHYLDGRIDEPFSEGYMGGSGRHRFHAMPTEGATGSCPVLAKIVQRCRGVDMLAGDRGQLFLPLCSLHQICYLCGEAPPMTCDMVFLSEADTTCEGDTGCQRAARSALMALRELHDNLADELDGECEANPCLPATLKLNIGWQRALQR